MSVSYPQLDDALIQSIVEETVERVLRKHKDICPVPKGVDSEDIGHAIGFLRDAGNGDISLGIETMRINNRWVSEIRQFNGKIIDWVAGTTIVVVIGALLAALWVGLAYKIRG